MPFDGVLGVSCRTSCQLSPIFVVASLPLTPDPPFLDNVKKYIIFVV
jgi:hypothetical protein